MQDLEFTISQYIDGALSAADRAALEARLNADDEARKILDEYRRLDAAMKSMPLPAFQWDALAQSISGAVETAHEQRSSRSYRMPAWIRSGVMPLALAASLFIVAGLGIEIFNSRHVPSGWPQSGTMTPRSASSSTVVAFDTDKAAGPAVEEIAIGPGTAVEDHSNEPIVIGYGQDDAATASHVMVASGVVPAHNTQPAASSFDME